MREKFKQLLGLRPTPGCFYKKRCNIRLRVSFDFAKSITQAERGKSYMIDVYVAILAPTKSLILILAFL